jgi:hypothetical protein
LDYPERKKLAGLVRNKNMEGAGWRKKPVRGNKKPASRRVSGSLGVTVSRRGIAFFSLASAT